MPTYKLVDEAGTWLTDSRLGVVVDTKPGDRIVRGRDDTLEVVEVLVGDEKQVLVVCPGRAPTSD